MAGDWIKMRVGLTTNPHVLRIAEHLLDDDDYLQWSGLSFGIAGCPAPTEDELEQEKHIALRITRYVTVTALLKFWGYANEHAKGDLIDGIRHRDVLEITGIPGFAEALEAAGWAEFDRDSGGVRMPNFEEHNTGARVRTSVGAERQKRYRERKKEVDNSNVTRNVTVTEREEKRREEKKDRERRGTRLPKDFDPTPEPEAESGINRATELANFRDYWTAKSGKEAVKLDWQATWRTWARKAHRKPADVARMTVPGSTTPDPGLQKLKADAANAAPVPSGARELLQRLKVH